MMLLQKKCLTFSKLRYLSQLSKSYSQTASQSKWQSVIGLEIHAQIQAKSKLFSGASTAYGAQINQQVALVDVAMPGTLPVLNARCVEAGVLTALALKCQVNLVSKFDRKHYFYADLPAGYQITQQRAPLGMGGEVSYLVYNPSGGIKKPVHKAARLTQLQLEQDSGKSLHDEEDGVSLIDLNRAGVALMEIVTEPDFTGSEEAAAFVKELQRILQILGTCDGKMEEGSMRVDASVSLHHPGEPLGVRSEVKNINSIRNVAKAIEFEIQRQKQILDSGGSVVNETRSFDNETGTTVSMRDKEALHDYRFMPEPNLPPLRLYTSEMLVAMEDSDSFDSEHIINVDKLMEQLPRLPEQERDHLCQNYGLPMEQACVLVNEEGLQTLFEKVVSENRRAVKMTANFLINDVLSLLNKEEISLKESNLNATQVGEVLDLLKNESISMKVAKSVLSQLIKNPESTASAIVEKKLWWQITETNVLEESCRKVIQANPDSVKAYKEGKTKVLNFLVGQVQKEMKGRAHAKKVTDILKTLLQ